MVQKLTIESECIQGFRFEADLVVLDAMRRWAKEPVGSYEDFIRRAYWREAELTDGFVVNLSRDDQSPLTHDEVMRADPYVLSVWYDTGDYSKHFRGEFGAGTHHVIGDECPKCHTFERTTKGRCVACDRDEAQRQQERYRLEHPEIEEARLAKQKAREEKWEAQRRVNEEVAQKRRAAVAVRAAARAANAAGRLAAENAAKLARAAVREEERIRAARERQAEQEAVQREKAAVKQEKAAENKFEGDPCRKCGGTTRYIKDRACVSCTHSYNKRREAALREKQQLAAVAV